MIGFLVFKQINDLTYMVKLNRNMLNFERENKMFMLCTQKNRLKARYYSFCSALKIFSMHMHKNVCIFLCIIFYNSKKLTFTYLRKTLINKG